MSHPGNLLKCRFMTSGDSAFAGASNHTLKGKVLGEWFSTNAILAPQGTLDNLWRHLLSQLGFGCWHLLCRSQEFPRWCNGKQEVQETQVQSLGQEDPLEEEVATLSNILAWRIPWKEGPGRLRSIGSQKSWM